MRTDKNKLFTIGQFAAIHEITKKTLMWYDEVGILKPAFIGQNGYRYYTYNQSPILETILMLRELNVSINEIKHFISNRSAYSMEKLLNDKLKKLDDDIKHLNNIKQNLVSHHKNMVTLLNIDLSEISIVQKDKQYLATVPMYSDSDSYTETEIEMVITKTKEYKIRRLHDVNYGSMIDVKNIYDRNFNNNYSMFIEMPKNINKKGLHIREKGLYLRAFFKGDWSGLEQKYCEILDYAKKRNLILYGFAYETGINESVINTIDDYITQIEIGVKMSL